MLFLASGISDRIALALDTPSRVVGGWCFYLKPLLASLQTDRPFFLLALSRRRAQLFRGSAGGLTPVRVADLPAGIDDPALTHEHGKSHTLHTVGRRHGGRVEAVFHGHADGGSDRKGDLQRYLSRVEAAVTAALRAESASLVVAAVEEEFAQYRRLSAYPHLHPRGIIGSSDHCSAEELHRAAWPLVAENAHGAAAVALEQYRALCGTGRTAVGCDEVLSAAAAGRLSTLLVSPEVDVWAVRPGHGRGLDPREA